MYKLVISVAFVAIFLSGKLFCQESSADTTLKFTQGQAFQITFENKMTISQQAMGQAIDFSVNATGLHTFKVTNSTTDNTTLHHRVKSIGFQFDGMGQKRTFDSNSEKDMKGMFGEIIKQALDKKYDMVIDPEGTTLFAFPDKIEIKETDSRLSIVTNLLKETLDIVQPPLKGTGSFFKVLPGKAVKTGDSWQETINTEALKSDSKYTVSAISDSTITVDLEGTSTTVTITEMMGNTSTTTMNNKFSGKIVVDKNTRLVREKQTTAEGSGNAVTSFGNIPVTSKSSSLILVTTEEQEK